MKINMNFIICIITIAIVINPTSAISSCGTFSSGNLLKTCNVGLKAAEAGKAPDNGDDAYNSGTCIGYLKGFLYMELAYSATLAVLKNPNASEEDIRKKAHFCLPDRVMNKELARVFINYMNQHPEEISKEACTSLLNAFTETYPCK